MKTWTKMVATALVMVPLTTVAAYADTTGTTTSTSTTAAATTTTSVQANPESRFDAEYQQNQQTIATLLQQAQGVQSADAAKFSAFISGVQPQVANLYASEQALVQLEAGLRANPTGPSQPGSTSGSTGDTSSLVQQEQGLSATLKADMQAAVGAGHHKGRNEGALKRDHNEINKLRKDLAKINATIKAEANVQFREEEEGFGRNIETLRATIVGLQREEFRVAQAWIASGQQSVTGSVYGTASVSSTVAATN